MIATHAFQIIPAGYSSRILINIPCQSVLRKYRKEFQDDKSWKNPDLESNTNTTWLVTSLISQNKSKTKKKRKIFVHTKYIVTLVLTWIYFQKVPQGGPYT